MGTVFKPAHVPVPVMTPAQVDVPQTVSALVMMGAIFVLVLPPATLAVEVTVLKTVMKDVITAVTDATAVVRPIASGTVMMFVIHHVLTFVLPD